MCLGYRSVRRIKKKAEVKRLKIDLVQAQNDLKSAKAPLSEHAAERESLLQDLRSKQGAVPLFHCLYLFSLPFLLLRGLLNLAGRPWRIWYMGKEEHLKKMVIVHLY